MRRISTGRPALRKWMLVLGLGAAGTLVSGQVMAGCALYVPGMAAPASWTASQNGGDNPRLFGLGIVGLWKFTFISDGTAYPHTVPLGATADFGLAEWHPDGTEIALSGGRAPSSGDVCMGAWVQSGRATYKLTHIGLAWSSADTVPAVSPAVYLGPATITETVTLAPSGASYSGTFTIDQYLSDGVTLVEHVSGTVTATRVTAD